MHEQVYGEFIQRSFGEIVWGSCIAGSKLKIGAGESVFPKWPFGTRNCAQLPQDVVKSLWFGIYLYAERGRERYLY